MNFARSLRGLRALLNRPGAHLGLAGGQVGDETEQGVARVDEAIKAGFGQTHVGEEKFLFLRVHAGNFGFDLRADRQHGSVLLVGDLLHGEIAGVVFNAVCKVGFAHVGGENDGLVRQQVDGSEQLGFQRLVYALKELQLALVLLVRLNHLLRLVNAAVEHLDIGENQLKVDCLNVAGRVDGALDVNNVVVFEAAHHMNHCVHLADVGEKLVAESLALRRALHKTRNVHKLDRRRGELFRLVHFCQLIEAFVRHGNNAHVRLNGAERVVRRLRPRIRDRIKKCALADVRQTNDT